MTTGTERRRCPGYTRHWFSRYGSPTFRLPRCERCGAPNPKWSKERVDMVMQIGESEVQALESADELERRAERAGYAETWQ